MYVLITLAMTFMMVWTMTSTAFADGDGGSEYREYLRIERLNK